MGDLHLKCALTLDTGDSHPVHIQLNEATNTILHTSRKASGLKDTFSLAARHMRAARMIIANTERQSDSVKLIVGDWTFSAIRYMSEGGSYE